VSPAVISAAASARRCLACEMAPPSPREKVLERQLRDLCEAIEAEQLQDCRKCPVLAFTESISTNGKAATA
jgi:hypothetical protein